MLHISCTRETHLVSALGGSYSCFAFIQKEDIYDIAKLAIKVFDDDYEFINSDWKKVANKMKVL